MASSNPTDYVRLSPAIVSEHFFFTTATLAICALITYRLLQKNSCPNLFPSPPSDPFLGHLRIIVPSASPWTLFAELGRRFGDVFYVSIVGRPVIVLNSAEAARDLMEKSGANYSGRPSSILHGQMIGWGNMLAFFDRSDRFRIQRRLMHQYLNSRASISLRPIHIEQVRILVKNLLVSPGNFHEHVVRFSSAGVVKLTYGHDILSDNDEYINLAAIATARGTAAGTPGMTPVDLFPFIRSIPSWFPGANFKREAKITYDLSVKMVDDPYNKVKEERASGTAQPSLMNSLLESYERSGIYDADHEVNMKFAGGTMYGAGVETSEIVIMTFFLMMVHNPEIVKRAQAEIDGVVESYQLPTFVDRDELPYVNCILKEVFRINPPPPLGLPHQSVEEDVYRGKTIPAGSMILPNIWKMMRDERYYSEPEKFIPERFLKKIRSPVNSHVHTLNTFNADDPSSLVFGFGRRICPRRFFADSGVFLAIASILALFDILPPIDPETGKETLPLIEYITGFTSKPKPFACRIIPRSTKHAALVDQECMYAI